MKPSKAGRPLSPFLHTMAELAHGETHTISAGASVAEAARMMTGLGVGSLLVKENEENGENEEILGILTKTDLVSRVLSPGISPEIAVREVVTRELVTVEDNVPIFDGLMLMIQHGISHLPVTREGRLTGLVSERDWLTFQGQHPAAWIRKLGRAETIEDLAALRKKILRQVEAMFQDEGTASALMALVTETNDRVVRRVVELTLAGMENGFGQPPVPFAWIAMGSEGRAEQTLATDQDNGLIFEDVPQSETEGARCWFLEMSSRVVEGLRVCGFPLCKGNIMASNPDLCLPLGEWREKFFGYLSSASEEALLRASIYFDFRCIFGEASLADRLWGALSEEMRTQQGFLRFLAGEVTAARPPVDSFGWRFRSLFRLPKPPLDLKKQALAPMVAAARVLALAGGSTRTNTLERLRETMRSGSLPEELGRASLNAYDFLMLLRLRQNILDARQGRTPSNHLAIRTLNPLRREFLADALRVVVDLQDHVVYQYGGISTF